MICPYCKDTIQDGAKACPLCGASFLTRERPMSIQKQAAQQELDKIKPSNFIIGIAMIIIGFIMLLYCIFTKGSSFFAMLFSIFTICISSSYCIGAKTVKDNMESILDDKKRAYICPNCKSPNIKQRFVKSSTVRGKSRTRVSKNINPGRPFTYRNYDREPSTTTNHYKTTYYCQVCGAVFDRPQVFEYK